MMINPSGEAGVTRATVENYAKQLLEIGMQMATETPWAYEPKDIVAAQELLLKQKSLDLQEEGLRSSLAKMFAGIGTRNPTTQEIEEAELVEDQFLEETKKEVDERQNRSTVQLQSQN